MHDTEEWKTNIETKTTLMRYRNEKTNLCEEKLYRNGEKYTIIMKARSNTLELECKSWGTMEENIFAKNVIQKKKI